MVIPLGCRLFATTCILGIIGIPPMVSLAQPISHPTQTSEELFYTYYGQKIPLNQRSDIIGVSFTPESGSRTRGTTQPLYMQLQETLQQQGSGTRGSGRGAPLNAQVQPIGNRYALVKLPRNTRSAGVSMARQRIQQQSYVSQTLPVLRRRAAGEDAQANQENILLPNEIVLSLEPNISDSRRRQLLAQNQLEVVRPLRFAEDRYLVRSQTATGTHILQVSNRLNTAIGVQSATPNFIQTPSYQPQPTQIDSPKLVQKKATRSLPETVAAFPMPEKTPFAQSLLPLQWHLDSTPRRGNFLPRTDLQITEAWEKSNGGRNVTVAVIDSLIQWDHPDLKNNIANTANYENALPGEEHGWDFSSENGGDPNTRLSSQEMQVLRPHFQRSFAASDQKILETYPDLAEYLQQNNPQASSAEIALRIRNYVRNQIASEFHGTWSAGVIAANPSKKMGAVGVAPNAKILPVRVFGLGGEIDAASLVEAVGYAAARDADIINMSLGGLLPDSALTGQIFDILDAHPDIAIVASAGNSDLDGVGFPAAIPGTIAVGATNMQGNRTFYSNYGGGLDVVAPGGDTSRSLSGGILTTGGTGMESWWRQISVPDYSWGLALDARGKYVQVQGTSFSAPNVSGVVALMKGVNPDLRWEEIATILKETASYDSLSLLKAEKHHYRLQAAVGFGTAMGYPIIRPSGIFPKASPISREQYFFGAGLVNALQAVEAAR